MKKMKEEAGEGAWGALRTLFLWGTVAVCAVMGEVQEPGGSARPLNLLLVVVDDLTANALSSYGNTVCQTPHVDALSNRGVRFTRAYCQATYCGPSRAAMLSGYYPHASRVFGYGSPRAAIGNRATWPEQFRRAGFHTARVSKIFHMDVPGGIEKGSDGADDPVSWSERHNSPGPEWQAPGRGETLEGNPGGNLPVVGGNTFVVVESSLGDLLHSDGKTASTAIEFVEKRAHSEESWFLAVGFVRPHVPFVAPAAYFEPFLPFEKLVLPPKHESGLATLWAGTPKAGVNYKTSHNMRMDLQQQRKALGGYYACVRYVDAQLGRILSALDRTGSRENTVVVFTSDHGFHLGEHDFWAKVSLREESARVPLIISVPGKRAAVCDAIVELQDLYRTTAKLCGVRVSEHVQGRDLSPLLDDPSLRIRDFAFSVAPMREGFLIREESWAYLQYGEDGSGGSDLYEMNSDPFQHRNRAADPDFQKDVVRLRALLAEKLRQVRNCDLH